MSGEGEERTVRRTADRVEAASGTPDDDLALADLTAGGPSPLEDLGAPWEGPAPGSVLPDLTGADPSGPAEEDRPSSDPGSSPATDDEWSPAPPLAADDGPSTHANAAIAQPDADWAPLPDLGRRGSRSDRPRRSRRSGDAVPARGRRRVRDSDPSPPVPRGDGLPSGDAERSDADGAPRPPASPTSAAPDDGASPLRGDGLPPGALGAGAAGVGQLFGDGEAASGAPPAEEPRRGRRKGRRRGKRDGADPHGDDTTGDAEKSSDRPLTAEERLQHALTLAYRHLSKRDRTVSGVRAHLEKREVDEPSIVGALKELTDFGYVDDERYATRFVEDKRRLEGWGHLRIEQGLRRTGIPREVADRALAEDPLRGDEDELAVEALEQRLAGRPLADDRARQKALRLLATKGYALETSYAAVRAYERRCAERADD